MLPRSTALSFFSSPWRSWIAIEIYPARRNTDDTNRIAISPQESARSSLRSCFPRLTLIRARNYAPTGRT
ncbi:hypothetical protein I7I53_01425 [Histoplasma capsulatum var. duboisii H88]|uniref:Uncharacterized protein n=1 Tax=Ajellomyces capsulatus (strain H88) TaxID=544711 RepID=A0A8A1LNG9_AJEC8|nr:hypothetical protein I7I53_01425 [Histoplasma capsulatum var. duboisii H88]